MRKTVAIVGIIALSLIIVTAVRADADEGSNDSVEMKYVELETKYSKQCLNEAKKAFKGQLKNAMSCECIDACFDSVNFDDDNSIEQNETCIAAEEKCTD